MKIYLFIFLLLSNMSYAQQSVIQDIQQKQNDIATQNGYIIQDENDMNLAESKIAADNTAIANDNNANSQYQANNAQTASGVNWDYFVSLEPQIPFSTWSKVDNGINWISIVPSLGINCGGITEANVNWPNWGNCESKGMTPGQPFGGKATGIAAFWCGNGSISGTC